MEGERRLRLRELGGGREGGSEVEGRDTYQIEVWL